MLLWTWVYKYPFKSLLLLLLNIYPKVKSLDYMVTLCLIFWGTTNIVFHNDYTISYSTSVAGFQLPYIFTNTCYFLFVFLQKIATLVSLNQFQVCNELYFQKVVIFMFKLSPRFELFLTSILKRKKQSFLQFYDIISNIYKFALWSFLFEMRHSNHLQVPVVLVFFHLLVILTFTWPWRIFLRSAQTKKNTCNVKVENSFYSVHFPKT